LLKGRGTLARVAVTLIASLVTALGWPANAHAIGGPDWVGACAPMTVQLISSGSPFGTASGPTTFTLSMSTPSGCVVNTTIGASGTLLATLSSTTGFSCLAGVASGGGTFQTSALGTQQASVAVVLVNTGGVLTVVAQSNLSLRFAGVGAALILPSQCSGTTVMGTGALAFEDPDTSTP
jgi:hypothetical protein